MRYYAEFIDDAARSPRQPAFATDVNYVTDLDWLRGECKREVARRPATSFVILDEDLRVVDVFGWKGSVRQSLIQSERLRKRPRAGAYTGGLRVLIGMLYTPARLADRHQHLRPLLLSLADAVRIRQRNWLLVQELEADRGCWGKEYVGLPPLRYRIAARIMVPLLDRLERYLFALATGCKPTRRDRGSHDAPF